LKFIDQLPLTSASGEPSDLNKALAKFKSKKIPFGFSLICAKSDKEFI
jgi:hypothetical protein